MCIFKSTHRKDPDVAYQDSRCYRFPAPMELKVGHSCQGHNWRRCSSKHLVANAVHIYGDCLEVMFSGPFPSLLGLF